MHRVISNFKQFFTVSFQLDLFLLVTYRHSREVLTFSDVILVLRSLEDSNVFHFVSEPEYKNIKLNVTHENNIEQCKIAHIAKSGKKGVRKT